MVYKAAAEIGELGDNGRRLRRSLAGDAVLRARALAAGGDVVVLGHTRWASVGIISEANAHPLNQEEEGRDGLPYVVAVLNGDVDNYVELREAEGLRIADAITTDAKIIPMLVARRLARGLPLERGVPPDGGVVPRIGRDRGAELRPTPTCSCSRCAAAGRRSTSASPTACSWWRASPTAWSSRPRPTCASTARRRATPTIRPRAAARSSCSTAVAPARSKASGASPTTAPSCRCAPRSCCAPR